MVEWPLTLVPGTGCAWLSELFRFSSVCTDFPNGASFLQKPKKAHLGFGSLDSECPACSGPSHGHWGTQVVLRASGGLRTAAEAGCWALAVALLVGKQVHLPLSAVAIILFSPPVMLCDLSSFLNSFFGHGHILQRILLAGLL